MMNENDEDQKTEPTEPVPFWRMFGIGFIIGFAAPPLLLIWGLNIRSPQWTGFAYPMLPLMGIALAAFCLISVFSRKYRGIFVGSLAGLGVLCLSIILYCSAHPWHF